MRILATGANSLYGDSLLTLLSSLRDEPSADDVGVVVWDLGLSGIQKQLALKLGAELRRLPVERLRPWPTWGSTADYSFKPYCLTRSGLPHDDVLWLDAGVAVSGSLDPVYSRISQEGIFLVRNYDHTNERWSSAECQAAMRVSVEDLASPQIQAGLVGYRVQGPHHELLENWLAWSLVEGVFAGPRDSHRHDQTVLSILAARAGVELLDPEPYERWNLPFSECQSLGIPLCVHRRNFTKRDLSAGRVLWAGHRIESTVRHPSATARRWLPRMRQATSLRRRNAPIG